jgi:hypothetical protein
MLSGVIPSVTMLSVVAPFSYMREIRCYRQSFMAHQKGLGRESSPKWKAQYVGSPRTNLSRG